VVGDWGIIMVNPIKKTSNVLPVARNRADEVRERHKIRQDMETLILSSRASLDFAKTMEKQPRPGKVLKRAMDEYKEANLGQSN
jgi:uncharacterized protein (DUF1778 family)